jgi:hypothetical protein
MTTLSMIRTSILILFLAATICARAEDITRIWLTHQSNDPSRLVVNWHTAEPADSVVEFGSSSALGQSARSEVSATLHHVEVPMGSAGTPLHYRVRSGAKVSGVHVVQGYPQEDLRVAVFADAGYAKASWGEPVAREKPHLLISAGDHIPSLHKGQPVPATDVTAFLELVDRYPALFASTPWMPLLGNHDREIRPRGPKPPPEPVYDVEATAFRSFFALPGDQWKWHFDVPDFGVRFVALDMSHTQDQGTTWQTNHPFLAGSPQYEWYREMMASSGQPFLITLYNERNSAVRGFAGGEYGKMIGKGSLAISGFGYFAERAEVDGVTYYNTSVGGTGTPYRDPKSGLLKSEDNFILLTFRRTPREVRVDLKNFGGEVLDSKTFTARPGSTAK